MKMRITTLAFAATLIAFMPSVVNAENGHDTPKPPAQKWSFSGPFGIFDRAQLQRGFQVYREVCSSCHSMSIPFRNLGEAGGPEFTEAQVKALAAEYKVSDGPNDDGNMFERPGQPSDKIPYNFANPQQAAAANNGALPPPMRLLVKARSYERGFPLWLIDVATQYQEQGQDYIYALLNGYDAAPKDMVIDAGQNYNTYMPGHKIAMAKPLNDGQVTYTDGSPQTVDQYSRDIVAFLSWTADPSLEERKKLGFRVLIFLGVLLGLLLYVKKKLWSELDYEKPQASH